MQHAIAVYGGSFNPPTRHHRDVATLLSEHFREVVVVPCGPRPDRPTTDDVAPIHRAAMVDLNFRNLPKVRVELFDLEANTFTRTHDLERHFRDEGDVWHVVSDDVTRRGRDGNAVIQREWMHGPAIWSTLRFAVIQTSRQAHDPADLPDHHCVFPMRRTSTSEEVRGMVFNHLEIDELVSPEVDRYIRRHRLYRGIAGQRQSQFRVDRLRCAIVADERNVNSVRLAAELSPFRDENDPNLIVVIGGDGTMLHAIREHWRRRLPFYGINTGHLGFLLNDNHQLDFVENELALYHLPLLWVEVEGLDGQRTTALAFNDAWVERATGQTAWLRLEINGQERIGHLVGDGMLMATAAGSTSYARAMGATPVPLDMSALLLVGSNVLKPPQFRPAVLPIDSRVTISTIDPVKRPLQAYIDGVPQGHVRALRIRASHIAAVELAFLPDHDPAGKLARIQFP